jgi:hypothetical protein
MLSTARTRTTKEKRLWDVSRLPVPYLYSLSTLFQCHTVSALCFPPVVPIVVGSRGGREAASFADSECDGNCRNERMPSVPPGCIYDLCIYACKSYVT